MSHLLSQFARMLAVRGDRSTSLTEGFASGVAHSLLERAGARSGQDPRQARELRLAADAYLRVVR